MLVLCSKTDAEGRGAILYVGAPAARRFSEWVSDPRTEVGVPGRYLFVRVRQGNLIGESAVTPVLVRCIFRKHFVEHPGPIIGTRSIASASG